MKQTNLEALNAHLFEAIEMLKNNSDPKASVNEKIDLDTARAITGLGKVIVEGYKVRAQVLGILSDKTNQDQSTINNVKELTESWGVSE
ncbi:MAG: hypothetical protein WCJ95_09595 [Mariniphaga sp.]